MSAAAALLAVLPFSAIAASPAESAAAAASPGAAASAPAPSPAAEDSSLAAVGASTYERLTSGEAWRGPAHWRALVSPYAYHWRYSPEHKPVYGAGLERQYDDRWLLGGALFSNSFGQPSAYGYLGRRYQPVDDTPEFFLQWSLGIMYGYTGKFASKVPLNFHGVSPGGLLTMGWQANRHWGVAFHLLGDAGVMLQIGYDYP